MEEHICSICGKAFVGYGNCASPVADAPCCDSCNANVVIPARLAALKKRQSKRAALDPGIARKEGKE